MIEIEWSLREGFWASLATIFLGGDFDFVIGEKPLNFGVQDDYVPGRKPMRFQFTGSDKTVHGGDVAAEYFGHLPRLIATAEGLGFCLNRANILFADSGANGRVNTFLFSEKLGEHCHRGKPPSVWRKHQTC